MHHLGLEKLHLLRLGLGFGFNRALDRTKVHVITVAEMGTAVVVGLVWPSERIPEQIMQNGVI